MTTKEIHIENIGKIQLTRRKGSKRISMRVKAGGVISVNYPWYASQREVLNFVQTNVAWIQKQQQKVAVHTVQFQLDETVETKEHRIQILSIEKGLLRAVLKDRQVVITIPETEGVDSERVQAYIRKVVIEICRKEAKNYLPGRVEILAKQHRFSYEKVAIKNLKSKWGSCSSLGNINLNLHLMRLPDHLIDYIILHELCHTKEMNHGPGFWALLDKVTNGYARALDQQMKTQSRLILK